MDTLTKEKNAVMNCGRYPSRDMQTREQKRNLITKSTAPPAQQLIKSVFRKHQKRLILSLTAMISKQKELGKKRTEIKATSS